MLGEHPEELEQPRDVLSADPHAGVRDLELQETGSVPLQLSDLDSDASALREFERIGDQVDQHLLDALIVRHVRGAECRWSAVDAEVDVLLCSLESEDVVDVFEQVTQLERIDVWLEGVRIELRHIEDVIY